MWAGYEYWWHQIGEKGTTVWACRALLCSQSKINTTKTAQHASVTVHQLFTGLFCSKFLFTRLLADELERTVFVCMGGVGHLRLQTQIKVFVCCVLPSGAASTSMRLASQVQDIHLSMKNAQAFSISYPIDSQGQAKAMLLELFSTCVLVLLSPSSHWLGNKEKTL